jgi:hypothetical protein
MFGASILMFEALLMSRLDLEVLRLGTAIDHTSLILTKKVLEALESRVDPVLGTCTFTLIQQLAAFRANAPARIIAQDLNRH